MTISQNTIGYAAVIDKSQISEGRCTEVYFSPVQSPWEIWLTPSAVALYALAQHIPGSFNFPTSSYQSVSMLATVAKTDYGELCTGPQRLHRQWCKSLLLVPHWPKQTARPCTSSRWQKGPRAEENQEFGWTVVCPPPYRLCFLELCLAHSKHEIIVNYCCWSLVLQK